QNDQVLSRKKEDIPKAKATLSNGLGGSDVGREEGPNYLCRGGVKIDQAVYLHLLSEEVVPWVQREYPTALLLFQQDGAPSHTSKLVQSFCTDMFADFWSKD
ncbi:Uncharacterized protein FKW44_018157, partial [Caligus rogercresseyi]